MRPRSPKGRARVMRERLAEEYPDVTAPLRHRSPFELLVATILSAQCTDEMVNRVTPDVFARWPDASALASAPQVDLEKVIHRTGFFRAKSRNLLGMSRALLEHFDGEVPKDLSDLVTLPGVGRKTGNVVRSVAFDLPGLPVDTHVGRLSRRLGLTEHSDPVKVERDVCALIPPAEWGAVSLRLIFHGRAVCHARRPRCGGCVLSDVCPSAFKVAGWKG